MTQMTGLSLFTIHFNSRFAPHLIVIRASNINSIVGGATCIATRKLSASRPPQISLSNNPPLPYHSVKKGAFSAHDADGGSRPRWLKLPVSQQSMERGRIGDELHEIEGYEWEDLSGV